MFWVQGQLRPRIRIRDHSRTHFDTMNPMIVLELPNELSVQNCIFWCKHYCLDLRKISTTWYPRLCFGNRAYPKVGQKINILNNFVPMVGNVELEQFWMHRKHGWTHISGRNSNTQLDMGFSDVLMLMWFYIKMWKLKKWFLKWKGFLQNQDGKPVFKMFSKWLKFYKNNFETQFCRLAHFTRKLIWGCYACFKHNFRDICTAWWFWH